MLAHSPDSSNTSHRNMYYCLGTQGKKIKLIKTNQLGISDTRDANKEVKTSTMVEGGWVGDKMLRLIGLVLMKCEHAHTQINQTTLSCAFRYKDLSDI